MKEKAERLVKTSSVENSNQIRQNIQSLEQKWSRLKKSVDNRILISNDYLKFVKRLNQFRHLALDLQEIIKTDSLHIGTEANLFEQRIQEKLNKFDSVYSELSTSVKFVIEQLRNVIFYNSHQFRSDSYIFVVVNRLIQKCSS